MSKIYEIIYDDGRSEAVEADCLSQSGGLDFLSATLRPEMFQFYLKSQGIVLAVRKEDVQSIRCVLPEEAPHV